MQKQVRDTKETSKWVIEVYKKERGGDMKGFHVEVTFMMGTRGFIDFLTSRSKSEDISGIEANNMFFSIPAETNDHKRSDNSTSC